MFTCLPIVEAKSIQLDFADDSDDDKESLEDEFEDEEEPKKVDLSMD